LKFGVVGGEAGRVETMIFGIRSKKRASPAE
jgi:hypothetical protein